MRILLLLPIYLLLSGCGETSTCEDCEGIDLLPEPRTEIDNATAVVAENPDLIADDLRPVFIELDGERFCCDDAYTNYEMSMCSQYVIDSLHAQMDSIYNDILQDIEDALSADEIIDAEHNIEVKNELISGQKIFLKNLKAERRLIAAMHQGRESFIHQDMYEVQMLESRIALLTDYWYL